MSAISRVHEILSRDDSLLESNGAPSVHLNEWQIKEAVLIAEKVLKETPRNGETQVEQEEKQRLFCDLKACTGYSNEDYNALVGALAIKTRINQEQIEAQSITAYEAIVDTYKMFLSQVPSEKPDDVEEMLKLLSKTLSQLEFRQKCDKKTVEQLQIRSRLSSPLLGQPTQAAAYAEQNGDLTQCGLRAKLEYWKNELEATKSSPLPRLLEDMDADLGYTFHDQAEIDMAYYDGVIKEIELRLAANEETIEKQKQIARDRKHEMTLRVMAVKEERRMLVIPADAIKEEEKAITGLETKLPIRITALKTREEAARTWMYDLMDAPKKPKSLLKRMIVWLTRVVRDLLNFLRLARSNQEVDQKKALIRERDFFRAFNNLELIKIESKEKIALYTQEIVDKKASVEQAKADLERAKADVALRLAEVENEKEQIVAKEMARVAQVTSYVTEKTNDIAYNGVHGRMRAAHQSLTDLRRKLTEHRDEHLKFSKVAESVAHIEDLDAARTIYVPAGEVVESFKQWERLRSDCLNRVKEIWQKKVSFPMEANTLEDALSRIKQEITRNERVAATGWKRIEKLFNKAIGEIKFTELNAQYLELEIDSTQPKETYSRLKNAMKMLPVSDKRNELDATLKLTRDYFDKHESLLRASESVEALVHEVLEEQAKVEASIGHFQKRQKRASVHQARATKPASHY